MNATIVDLRYRMKDVLRAVDNGETVTILYRGKPKATLTPISTASRPSNNGTPKTADQPLFGLWNDRTDLTDPSAWIRDLRRPRALPAETHLNKRRIGGTSK